MILSVTASVLAQWLHGALVLALAPLLAGVLAMAGARLRGRRMPSVLDPWREIWRRCRQRPVLATTAGPVTRAAPYVAAASTWLALLLVPGFALGMALAPVGDVLLILGLLGLSRAAAALAEMDAGTAEGGIRASGRLAVGAFAAPVLLLCLLVLVMLAGSSNLDAIAGFIHEAPPSPHVPLALTAAALLAVALAGALGVAGDDGVPAEASGRHLALWRLEGSMRLLLWLCLPAALFLPWGLVPADAGPLAWLLGMAAWLAKLAVLGGLLAVLRGRGFPARRPQFLGAALLLAALAAALMFVSAGLA